MPARPRRALLRVASLVVVSAFGSLALSPPVLASETDEDRLPAPRARTAVVDQAVVLQPALSPALVGLALARDAVQTTAAQSIPPVSPSQDRPAPSIVVPPARPRGLVPLYVSFAVLQGLDVHSTLTAIHNGAVEQNALMAPFVKQPAAFVAFKAAATAGVIVAADRLSKRNRVGAYVLMFAMNSAYAVIVAHNYRVATAR